MKMKEHLEEAAWIQAQGYDRLGSSIDVRLITVGGLNFIELYLSTNGLYLYGCLPMCFKAGWIPNEIECLKLLTYSSRLAS